MRATTRRRHLDLASIRAAVEAAEQRTSAEIVVSIAPFFVGRVWEAARRAFDRLGIAGTRRHNGVLVFVVPSRHEVVVLADDGALVRIHPTVWHDAASRIASACARGRGTAGIVEVVDWLSRVLGEAFPPEPGDVNELPDVIA